METQEMLKDGTIIKKAYQINLNKLNDGYLSDIIMCHAENINKAKTILLNDIKYDNWKLRYSNVEINYLNIPVIRRKSDDIVLFEGNEVIRYKISDIVYERERIDKINEILADEAVTYCYIYKSGQGYYCDGRCGYTYLKTNAGIYEKKDAASDAKSVRELSIIPIDIEEHNKMINDKINDISKKIIC